MIPISASGLQFPIYIPTKGRHKYMMTSRVLTGMGVPHYLIVEPQQVIAYQHAVDVMKLNATILPLDMSFKEKYELCDDLGLSKSTGSGPARNFGWEHSIANGFAWHWMVDDNIKKFHRLNRARIPMDSPAFWAAMEDFVLRYKNVAMAGPNYSMFATGSGTLPPIIINSRVYSCNLIRNDVPFRWRGRYNEDVILSLDLLKAGWCTIQFNAFLQDKMGTQSMPGGNTSELYHGGGTAAKDGKYSDTGTIEKSQMLVRVHPDVAVMKIKYGRWHHHVDYSAFKKRRLIRRDDIQIPTGIDNYGMILKRRINRDQEDREAPPSAQA